MKTHHILLPLAALWAALPCHAEPLPRSTPEEQGVPSRAVLDFVRKVDETIDTLDSFMIVRHGHVIAEGWWQPAAPEVPHVLHSLSKSFTSTAIGLAIEEGKLQLDDPVVKFFPDDLPDAPSDHLKAMTVRDLLTMTCGHDSEPGREGGPAVKAILAHPVPHAPGTHFQYNTMGTYLLSAILGKATGETTLDYLGPRLFEPLGIEGARWAASPEGHTLGGYGLYLKTEDIAKFGQLYLNGGMWNGNRLIPAKWVDAATRKQVSNADEGHADIGSDWQQGYGYQFWRCRHGAYRGDGKDGQFCVVLPEQEMVVAITASTRDMQGELNAIWDHLLPAVRDEPLPADEAATAALREATSKLVAHPAKN